MAEEPVWQSWYIDLSDARAIRFGVRCPTCGAEFATPSAPVTVTPQRSPAKGGARERARRKQKYQRFLLFDGACHELIQPCRTCHRPTCPDCWSSDHGLCAECAGRQGDTWRPASVDATVGPLADGRLTQLRRGRRLYAVSAGTHSQPRDAVAAELTDVSTSAGAGDSLLVLALLREGQASGMVVCPRCATDNFDFVSACRGCGLNLVQLCPSCEEMNGGEAEFCTGCGSALDHNDHVVVMERPATVFAPGEVRQKTYRAQQVGKDTGRRNRITTWWLRRGRRTEQRTVTAVAEDRVLGAAEDATQHADDQQPGGCARARMLALRGLEALVQVAFRVVTVLVVPLMLGLVAASELSPSVNSLFQFATHINIQQDVTFWVRRISDFWDFIHRAYQ